MRQRCRAFRRPQKGSRKGKYLVGVIALLTLTLTPLGLSAGSPSTADTGPSGASHATSSTSGECSKATARRLVNQQHLNGLGLPDPVAQVLCGPFTGAGSEAMAVTIGAAPTCWPIQSWALFSRTGGRWRLVMQRNAFIDPPLVAVGADIRETAPVFRHGDPRCVPSGGSRAHVWHWNGSRLIAGPWRQVTPGATVRRASFFSPSRSVGCDMADDPADVNRPGVYCRSRDQLHAADLRLDGRLYICRGTAAAPCIGGAGTGGITLAYDKQITVGRFRCESLQIGVRCKVIESGKGFLINRDRVTRVGS